MTKKKEEKSQESGKDAMHKMKRETLESGKSHKILTDSKQAMAIGLSETRKNNLKYLFRA